jgi:DNA (cytosine-5)-methyltransferase 1
MRVAGLFAGIGGLEAGLSAAGHEAIAFAEIWKPAAAVLAAHFPDVPRFEDVREVERLPAHDLMTAGFPCQDLSQAGRTAGIGGPKSGLVDHVFRLMDVARPAHVLLENVSFMLSLDRGAAMARLVDAFGARGYRWAYRTVDTLAFLPQRRRRVFFLASRTFDPADVLFADEVGDPARSGGRPRPDRAYGFYWTEGIRGLGWGDDCVPTLKNGSTVGIPSPPAVLRPGGAIVTPDIADAERLQGFAAGWTAPAESVGPGRLRWALVGNAVSVPVARWIGGRLAAPGRHDPARDRRIERDGRWPPAARLGPDGPVEVEISAHPMRAPRAALERFLEHPGKPLSVRATAGFLERLGRTRLRLPEGFRDAVAGHLERMRGEVARAAE